LRKAGAVFIAVTNVPEAGLWWETSNGIYGLTRNPYDLRLTPGGSSGGEGALISAAGSIFGVGSDFGGSIRIPAALNGIFGLKPSPGS
jgi:Asp-tRNA(Asn)/Glu-tRNA(Gln) amidotransferase A subunit family amidase